ncbi:hypothetical protein [Streptomyces aureus]|uniref:hypothetical protein n=1 Tax=Streptomyces aureus TaxID=193461 RepID=UPI0036B7396E
MHRQQILDLYEWADGICFRHPEQGQMPTTIVGVIHPAAECEKPVRGCEDCVIAMEDTRREHARREGEEYEPGHVGVP